MLLVSLLKIVVTKASPFPSLFNYYYGISHLRSSRHSGHLYRNDHLHLRTPLGQNQGFCTQTICHSFHEPTRRRNYHVNLRIQWCRSVNIWWRFTVFENRRKSRIQHCEHSELRLHFIKNAKNGAFWRVFENLKLAVKQCYQTLQTGQF